ncbi:MAG: DUF4173 domain-containing protein [Clostridiaceae bacterium]|nr:DUF4173 domain-containing protein [Clostridiaceae bacterium]
MSNYHKTIIASIITAAALVEFFLIRGGQAQLNLTLLFATIMAVFFLTVPRKRPEGAKKISVFEIIMIICIIGVTLSYTLFDNSGLQVLNFISLAFMMAVLFLSRIADGKFGIERPGFLAEVFAGIVSRPFVNLLGSFFLAREEKKVQRLSQTPDEVSADPARESSELKKKVMMNAIQIIIGLMIGVPLILVLSTLLAGSDAVFGTWTSQFLSNIAFDFNLVDLILRGFMFVMVWPFVDSVIISYFKKRFLTNRILMETDDSQRMTYLPSFTVGTVLVMVNVVYIVFAVVQAGYFFGAFSGVLPSNITYAEYARSGFYELLAVSVINVIMVMLTVTYTRREGKSGIFIRSLGLSLIALSAVQVVSAMSRMYLYVDAYGLSEDRYLSSAFMLLIAFVFLLLTIREFVPKFQFFKGVVLAGAIALLMMNFSVPNARVAEYNINRYLSGKSYELDVEYLYENSADSLWVLNESKKDSKSIAVLVEELEDHDNLYIDDTHGKGFFTDELEEDWATFNLSRFRVMLQED